MLDFLFQLCCILVYCIAYLTGYSYEVVNTFLFIYLEPAILLITGWLITIFGIKYFKTSIVSKIILFPSIAYNLVISIVIAAIWKHYLQFNMDIACQRAYIDLDTIVRITGLGYINTNLFLFIILFLIILIFNVFVILCQKMFYQRSLLHQNNRNTTSVVV